MKSSTNKYCLADANGIGSKMSGFFTNDHREGEVIRPSQLTTVPDSMCGLEEPERANIDTNDQEGMFFSATELLLISARKSY